MDKDFHPLRCNTCEYWTNPECPRKGITYLKDADMVIDITGCASHSAIKTIILKEKE
jgi:hypothetical protein